MSDLPVTGPWSPFANRLADKLVADRAITSKAVERAFRAVPRHLFLDRVQVWHDGEQRSVLCDHANPDPHVLESLYQDTALGIGRDSTSSQPTCMAWMIEDLGLTAGVRVLEVGTGSGWNAAIIAQIVGSPSLVFSIECNGSLSRRAARHLRQAGCGGVTVVHGDGAEGYPAGAPYDAVIVTAGAADLSPAWLAQLTPAGSILFPLHLFPGADPTMLVRGMRGRFTRLITFVPLQSPLLGDRCAIEPTPPDDLARLQAGEGDTASADFILGSLAGGRSALLSLLTFRQYSLQPGERQVEDGLVLPDSAAYLWTDGEQTVFRTFGGSAALDRIRRIHDRWLALGSPRLEDYAITILPAGHDGPTGACFVIRRKHFSYWFEVQMPPGGL